MHVCFVQGRTENNNILLCVAPVAVLSPIVHMLLCIDVGQFCQAYEVLVNSG